MQATPDKPLPPRARGRDAVRRALLEAAGEMLGEVGPKSLSVRDIAERAGVNHGQVHHYFGGKRGLLEAAMHELGSRHFDRMAALSDADGFPRPLALAEDRPYYRALCQSVMDGDVALVMTVDADDDVSVPRRVLRSLRARNPETDDLDTRAHFAAFAAMQLGWVAFEELLFAVAEVETGDETAFRERVKDTIQRMIDDSFARADASFDASSNASSEASSDAD